MVENIDHKVRLLQVAVKNLDDKSSDEKVHQREYTGVVFYPRKVFDGIEPNAEDIYEEFFEKNQVYQVISVETEQDPEDLANILVLEFGVKRSTWMDGIIATFQATEEQARSLLEDLAKTPKKYF